MKPTDEIRPVRVVLSGVFTSHSPSKGTLHHVLLLESNSEGGAGGGLFYEKLQTQNRFSSAEIEVNQFVDPGLYSHYARLRGRDIVGCQCMRDPDPHASSYSSTALGTAVDDIVNGNAHVQHPDNSAATADANNRSSVANWTVDTMPRASTRRAYFCVYSYPIGKVFFGSGERRQRLSITFTVDAHDTFAENLTVAELWRDAIRCQSHDHGPAASMESASDVDVDGWQLKSTPITSMASTSTIEIVNGSSSSSSTSTLNQKIPCDVCQNQRKLLILVNPHSGPGKAAKIFQEKVVPLLAEAGVSYDLVTTARAKEAQDIVREANLDEWHGIVIVSGDGLVFEVINGLMERPDWSTAIRTPLGIIPGGSGNGLAKIISHASREPLKTNPKLLAAFIVAKGRATPMDVIRVTTTNRTLYSFLSIGWGIIADIDIESERLRALGGSRFTIWALARIIDLRVYRGRISYIPAFPASTNHSNANNEIAQRSHMGINNEPHGDHVADCELNLSQPSTSCGRHHVSIGDNNNGFSSTTSPPTLLPPLDEPLPECWVREDEANYVLVYVVFQSHISSSAIMAPDAELDDGLMWLMIVREGVTRTQLTKFLLAIDSGKHIDLPFVEMKPVHAFRLEPISAGGHLTVDGELIEYGPVQAEVLRGVARVMTH